MAAFKFSDWFGGGSVGGSALPTSAGGPSERSSLLSESDPTPPVATAPSPSPVSQSPSAAPPLSGLGKSHSARWIRGASLTANRATGTRYYMSTGQYNASDDKTPIWLTALNIMNGVLGVGVIGLPYVIDQSGLPMGIILCFVVAIISNFTLRLLANLGVAHGAPSYEDLSFRAFGPFGFYLVAAMQGLFSFGAMCSYLVIIADTLPDIIATNWPGAPPLLLNRQAVLAGVSFAAVLPLCLYRAYGQLAKYSIIKVIALTFLVITVAVFSNQIDVQTSQTDQWIYRSVHSGVFPAVGTVAFAFVCHHQTFLAYRSLRNATQRRFAIVIHISTLGAFALSLTLGIAGYLTFLDTTIPDFLDNYRAYVDVRNSPMMTTARSLLVANMILTFPGDVMVARSVLENMLERRRRYSRWVALRSPVHDVRLLTTLKAQEDADRAASADRWRCSDGCTRALAEHIGLTLGLFAAALGVALATSNLGVVLEITGSFSAVFLVFVLPAAIRLRLGPTPDDVLPKLHRNNWPAWGVLFFGLIAFVTGTGFSLIKAITGEDFVLGRR